MTSDLVIAAALESLAGMRHAHSDAVQLVPRNWGWVPRSWDDHAWSGLGLNPTFEGQPATLARRRGVSNGRDVGTHFAAGKTGSSTVRRSLAALLVEELALVAVPRNLAKPDGSANFGLTPQAKSA